MLCMYVHVRMHTLHTVGLGERVWAQLNKGNIRVGGSVNLCPQSSASET